MKMYTLRRAAILPVLLLLAACTSAQILSGGARQGVVTKIKSGAQLKNPEQRECVAALPRDDAMRKTWVVVEYSRGRGMGHKTVLLPSGETFAVGDAVLVDLSDCDVPLRHASKAAD
jgi:hypothetical protein